MRKIVDLRTGQKLGYVLIVFIAIASVAVLVPMSKIVGGGLLIYYPSEDEETPGGVTFNHYTHVEKIELKCTDCHYNLFASEQHASGITMEGIFEGEWCGACHDGDKAFGVDECNACHVVKKFWLIKNII